MLDILDKFLEARIGQFERNRKLFISICVLIVFFCFFSIYSIVELIMVSNNVSTMQELDKHDKLAIQNSVYFRQQEIQNLSESLWRHRILSIQGLHEYLRNTNDQFGMLRINVVSEDGELYSSNGTSKFNNDYLKLIKDHPDGFIMRYGGLNGVLLLGAPVHSFRVEDKHFNYVLGEILLRDLADTMKIDSYEGAGISFVVDEEGNFIVSAIGSGEDNIFTLFEGAKLSGYSSPQAFHQDMINRAEINSIMDHQGEKYIVTSAPMDYNWTIISIVPKSVFSKQSNIISFLFLAMLSFIMLTIAIVIVLLLRSRDRLAQDIIKQHYTNKLEVKNHELELKQEQLEQLTNEQDEQIKKITALNESLDHAKKQADAANIAKTTFLFNMSHDIRTPMNAIMGFRDLLERHQEEPEKRANYLQKIEESSTVLLSIINNVLEMARIEKSSVTIEEIAWSAEQFNDTLYSIFEEMMKQKGIEFTRKIEVKHHYVLCDTSKLREIFINIISNSYKYTKSGGKVYMHLQEIPHDVEGWAMYKTTIRDTGIGMSEEFLPHMFDDFSREKNTTEAKIEGTGLGLPIVKRLVNILNGKIEVESKKGEGTIFTVYLPHKITDKNALVAHSGIEIDPKLFIGKRILLAEDYDFNAEIAIELLEEAGFTVERAVDGQVCVEMLANAADDYYSLILMDIQMPNMNGYEATRKIRAMYSSKKSKIPILAMTANAFEEDRQEAFRSGMNGHMAKPVKISTLIKEMAKLLS